MAGGRQGVARLSLDAHAPMFERLGADRWHFQHGPIDLILEARGDRSQCERAVAECQERFADVLPRLVHELDQLRRPADECPSVTGPVARRMLRACAPFAQERFVTPMAAVAGAVADELIGVFRRPGIERAHINNGGDIALHIVPGQAYRVGICSNIDPRQRSPWAPDPALSAVTPPALDGILVIDAATPVRGIATSGWRGRSFSLGIADSVTVLAACAAAADVAATLIANAVNCDHPSNMRAPANTLKDDTDLGSRWVTVQVPPLPPALRALALERGRAEAECWRDRGLIHAAALFLQGETRVVLPRPALPRPASPRPANSQRSPPRRAAAPLVVE